MLDMLIQGGRVVTPAGVGDWDVGIEGEKIVAVAFPGLLPAEATQVIDARGKIVVPGGIETHAHAVANVQPGARTLVAGVPNAGPLEHSLGAIWGGMNPGYERYGVRYYSSLEETLKTWSASIKRFQSIAEKQGADVYLSIHQYYDKMLDKAHALKFRGPGDTHTFVSAKAVQRFLTVMGECTDAQLARATAE